MKIAAFEYLVRHMGKESIPVMEAYFSDPDYRVRSAALVSIVRETNNNPLLKNTFHLKDQILTKSNELAKIDDSEVKSFLTNRLTTTTGYANIPETFFILDHYLNADDPILVQQAIAATGTTRHTYFMDKLIGFITDEVHKQAATAALLFYGPGIVNILSNLAKNSETTLAILLQFRPLAEQSKRLFLAVRRNGRHCHSRTHI